MSKSREGTDPAQLPRRPSPSRYRVALAGGAHEVVIDEDGAVTLDGVRRRAALTSTGAPHGFRLTLDAATLPMRARSLGSGRWEIEAGGRAVTVEVLDERQARIRALSRGRGDKGEAKPLVAPMPGLVVQVAVQEGDRVAAGDRVMIVEAMKMENELCAARPARVTRVRVAPGDAVEKGQILVEFAGTEPA